MECKLLASLTRAKGKDVEPIPDLPRVVFAGRSNVGKSSLINSLVGSKALARTSSTPGRTRSINLFQIDHRWIFVDLPGYGYARVSKQLRESWRRLIESFLESQRHNIRLVILILDSRHVPTQLDKMMQDYLAAFEIPMQIVATKIDKVRSSRRIQSLKTIEAKMEINNIISYSSRTGEGKRDLWRIIQEVES